MSTHEDKDTYADIYSRCTGMRDGGRMAGYDIDKTWCKDFANEPTIATTSFLAIPGGKRSPGGKKTCSLSSAQAETRTRFR